MRDSRAAIADSRNGNNMAAFFVRFNTLNDHIIKKEGTMKYLLKKRVVAAAFAASMLMGYGSAHAESYSFIDLGNLSRALSTNYTLQMPENKAFGINDSG